MANASYVQPNFLGGEISQFAQGRFDKPEYHTSLNVCFNAFPAEIGPWVRRPGSVFAGTTRGGAPGRVIKFDFEQASPYTLEFTNNYLRFRSGTTLISNNDAQVVVAISAANPAVVQTTTAHRWLTGATVMFGNLAATAPLLQNRQFLLTVIDATHFSLQDALTTANIDGSTLGALAAGATVSRVQELVTPYTGGAWSTVRAVQAETTDILLHGAVAPQALTVTTLPTSMQNAIFAISPATFNDGPYLDPLTNGAQLSPSAVSGIITLTIAFPAYNGAKAYAAGAFVTAAGINYISLADQNVNNTPASSPAFWSPTSAGAAIGPAGFQGSDIGRLVRLLSEPAAWTASSVYAIGNVVSYNPSGLPGGSTYWQSLTGSNSGNAPGANLTNWQLMPQGAAIWTWGKIVALSNAIDRALAGSVNIGSMTQFGGLSAAFNGSFSQNQANSAGQLTTGSTSFPTSTATLFSYVGKSYASASDQKIQQATVYPSSDRGFAYGYFFTGGGIVTSTFQPTVTLNLRANVTPPASSSDGFLLGTTGPMANTTSAVTIISADQATLWKYVWIEEIMQAQTGANSFTMIAYIGQISFFNPPGTGTSSGVNVEILGPPLLYTNPVATWRLGVYSTTTGWPTCGTYHEGRLWLGGAVPNRFDASVSNGILGSVINFAPTDQYGVVAANNGISYTLNSDSVNPIFWMDPDLQGIIMGTQAAEWLVQAPTNGPLSPTNISGRRVTKIGCANVEPRRTEHTSVFVQRYSQKLMEYFSDVYSGKFSAPNIADKAQHITRSGIAEIAYQQAITPIIWGRGEDGSLFGVTYKRDTLTTAQGPTFNGWHRHALGSNRTVESICTGPSTGGNLDSLTMVTTPSPTGIRHIEVLTDSIDEQTPLSAAWFLDDAVTPSSFVQTDTPSGGAPYGGMTLNGLWHLNGQTVTVFAGGLDCGDFAIANGSCFIPYGDSISAGTGGGLFTAAFVASFTTFPIVVGFTFTSQGQLVRPVGQAETGARNGPGFGKIRRNHRYSMQIVNSLGMSIGADFSKMFPLKFMVDGAPLAALAMFSGIQQDSLDDDYGYDGMICWQISRPYPGNVVAIGGNISTQDQ